ncbi:MAG: hypothetical protein IT238_12000 [Bacteroidia bacterium]|nr:hypothetical protein [Bacteroidia bacterium]MCZ2249601.1 hypothetical protein [Bacteroidia bacterium]
MGLIKNIIKDYLVPPGYLKLIRKKEAVNMEAKFDNKLFEENLKFKNLHQGERCFILASGPSIRTQDLKKLQNELCIAVSHFHLHDDIRIIRPQYHVLAPQHAPFNFNDSSKYFIDFKEQYKDINPHIFLGLTNYAYNYFELLKHKPNLVVPHLHYLNYAALLSIDENNYLNDEIWDITKDLFGQRTVIYGAIQLAVYMGVKQIYLLGADHDYLNDTKRTTNHHFYKEEKGISDKEHLSDFSSEKWFYEYYMRWKQYRLMNEYCVSKGVQIFNATNGGMLDVFERVSYESLWQH